MARSRPFGDPQQASERFRSLLEELVTELGSRSAAAAAVGLSPSYVTKLLNDQEVRIVGHVALDVACRQLGLSADYFTASETAATYKNFVTGQPLTLANKTAFGNYSKDALEKRDAVRWLFGGAEHTASQLVQFAGRGSQTEGFSEAAEGTSGMLAHVAAKQLMDASSRRVASTVLEAIASGEAEIALQAMADVGVIVEMLTDAIRNLRSDQQSKIGDAVERLRKFTGG